VRIALQPFKEIMANTRIYIVNVNGQRHLVEASNPSQAIRHVTTAGVTCEAASSKQVAETMAAGVKLEVVGSPGYEA